MPDSKTGDFIETFAGEFRCLSVDFAEDARQRAEALVMQARVTSQRVAATAERTRVAIVCDVCDDESLRLATATRAIFDDAGLDVEWVKHDLTADMPAPDRHLPNWASAEAVFVVAASECADSIALMFEARAINALPTGDVPHASGHAYAVVSTRQADGMETGLHHLSHWLDHHGMIDASAQARLNRFLGSAPMDAGARDGWCSNEPVLEAALQTARELVDAMAEIRAGTLAPTDLLLSRAQSALTGGVSR